MQRQGKEEDGDQLNRGEQSHSVSMLKNMILYLKALMDRLQLPICQLKTLKISLGILFLVKKKTDGIFYMCTYNW